MEAEIRQRTDAYIHARHHHPAWQLLAARRAPLILSCLQTLFEQSQERKWVIRLESRNPKAELGMVFKALDALDLRASLGDEKPPSSSKDSRVSEPSTLDEVFRQLQRPKRT